MYTITMNQQWDTCTAAIIKYIVFNSDNNHYWLPFNITITMNVCIINLHY